MAQITGPARPIAVDRLSGSLRQLRRSRGYSSAAEVARALGWDTSRLTRLESGARMRKPRREVIGQLLDFYEVADEERRVLLGLVEAARAQGWWHAHRAVLGDVYQTYLGYETWASRLRGFHPFEIPRLLQTERYARAALAGSATHQNPDQHKHRVQVNLTRQQRLTCGQVDETGQPVKPLDAWLIMGEAALHMMVGGPDVMADQFEQLAEYARWPNVTLQVFPFAAGAHPGQTQFVILSFPDDIDPEMAYAPNLGSTLFVDAPPQMAVFRRTFEEILARALTCEQTVTLLEKTAAAYRAQQ